LVIDGHAPSSLNYVFTGGIALISGVQAKTFITPTYRGQIDLIISLQSVPVASLDRRFIGHINLVMEVAAIDVQFVQIDTSDGSGGRGLIAIPNPGGGRQLVAIPN